MDMSLSRTSFEETLRGLFGLLSILETMIGRLAKFIGEA